MWAFVSRKGRGSCSKIETDGRWEVLVSTSSSKFFEVFKHPFFSPGSISFQFFELRTFSKIFQFSFDTFLMEHFG